MTLYLDSAYIAKCYVNEPDAQPVRELAWQAEQLHSSVWCLAEFACALHRKVREGTLNPQQASRLHEAFRDDIARGVWLLLPITMHLMGNLEVIVQTLPPDLVLRAGDAVHLITARDAGFSEVWTNDRRLLAAAPHFGVQGRSA